MLGLGYSEWLLILVLLLVVLGGDRLTGAGRALGDAVNGFRAKAVPVRRRHEPRDEDLTPLYWLLLAGLVYSAVMVWLFAGPNSPLH